MLKMQAPLSARQRSLTSVAKSAAAAATPPTYTIGQLAMLSGLPVKTIRFYSDGGVLPAGRSGAGHRRYAEDALARLQLIRSPARP